MGGGDEGFEKKKKSDNEFIAPIMAADHLPIRWIQVISQIRLGKKRTERSLSFP